MELAFWNTKTRRKEQFRPLDRNRVKMYACGPTVYDRAHIGNARPAVVFDQLYRLLRHIYGKQCVTYVRNITDVDDKINAKALDCRAEGDERPLIEIIRAITDQTIGWYHADLEHLGVLPPDFEPRATDFVPNMICMIQSLINKGHAYHSSGHVLFDVGSYPDYGRLARRSLDEMRAGARVEIAPYKRNNLDFVLWKPSPPDIPGWESPWGRGRPGWHIECSAMSSELLGESFDIHGGGIDLAFPHHENELAQSMCAHPNGTFASYWMHNGFVQVEGQKMAKSLGNFLTVRDLIDRGVSGSAVRFVLLSAYYRKPLDWTETKLREAETVLDKWSKLVQEQNAPEATGDELAEPDGEFLAALCDDLDTPKAFARMHELYASGDAEGLRQAITFLGLARERRRFDSKDLSAMSNMCRARDAARKDRNYAIADYMRQLLVDAGVSVMDGKESGFTPTSAFDRAKLDRITEKVIDRFGYMPGGEQNGRTSDHRTSDKEGE